MIALERKRYIINALNQEGVISLRKIAKDLQVSEITIRRDFEKLEAEGKLKRVQGGATIEGSNPQIEEAAELTMTQKIPIHMQEKERIAKFVEKTVSDGECVFLDAGTTMIPLANELMKKNIRIVTYNTLLIKKLSNPKAKIFMIGGEHLPYYGMNIGSIAQDMLRQFYFNKAFISCTAVDLDQQAVYMTETESLTMKKIAMRQSKHSYLLADSHKFFSNGFLKLCDLSAFDKIYSNQFYTEKSLPERLIMIE